MSKEKPEAGDVWLYMGKEVYGKRDVAFPNLQAAIKAQQPWLKEQYFKGTVLEAKPVVDRPRVSPRPEGMSELDIANLVSAAPYLQGAGVQSKREPAEGVSEAELQELAAGPWKRRR